MASELSGMSDVELLNSYTVACDKRAKSLFHGEYQDEVAMLRAALKRRLSSRHEVPAEVLAAAKSILSWNKSYRGLAIPPHGPNETLMATYNLFLSQATPEVK